MASKPFDDNVSAMAVLLSKHTSDAIYMFGKVLRNGDIFKMGDPSKHVRDIGTKCSGKDRIGVKNRREKNRVIADIRSK